MCGRVFRSIAYRLVALLADGDPYRSVSVHGISLRADVTDFVFSGIYFGGVSYEPQLTRFLCERLKPGGVFVDVGANSGYFSLLAASLAGTSGRVYAFEPNPPVARALACHIALNAMDDRIVASECALSDTSQDRVPLFVTEAHTGFATLVGDSAIAPEYLGAPTTVGIRTTTFDDWRAAASVDRVDLMKIDVEGFESQVLAGMRESLAAGRVAALVVETSWDSPAHRRLVSLGFQPLVLESVGPADNIAYERPALD